MKQYEADEQKKLFRWADFMKTEYPELDMMFHIPNGGSRNKLEAANLKKQGVRAGVPDICLPVARGGYHGLFIELKFGKNKTTAKQDEWLARLNEKCYAVAVCYGCTWEQAQRKYAILNQRRM